MRPDSNVQTATPPPAAGDPDRPAWLRLVHDQVDSMKFGTVLITVHDSRVVQLERMEKLRLDRPTGT